MKRVMWFLLCMILSISILIPPQVQSKRPSTSYKPFLNDIFEKARKMEARGEHKGAEEIYLGVYKDNKRNRFYEEVDWLDYMACLRSLICFYYRQENFTNVEWYFREYSDELEDDEFKGNMYLSLFLEIQSDIKALIDRKEYRKAEVICLSITDKIGSELGYRHFIMGELYKYTSLLYVKMGNNEKAKEYAKKAGSLGK